MPVALLPERACLRLTGTDVRPFLQGIVTQDIQLLTPERALYAALLTPQGKYLFDFFLVERDSAVLMEAERARLGDLERRLKMYRLRAAVDIASLADSHQVHAAWGALPAQWPEGAFRDPRLPALGLRYILPAGQCPPGETASAADYDRHRLALGVPDGSRDIEVDKTLILEANIDALAGVSFTKGCYVGQELTARMKHRGTVRRRLLPVRAEGPMPAPGTPIQADGRPVGVLRSGQNGMALGLIRLEDLDKAPLTAAGVPVTPVVPDWLAGVL